MSTERRNKPPFPGRVSRRRFLQIGAMAGVAAAILGVDVSRNQGPYKASPEALPTPSIYPSFIVTNASNAIVIYRKYPTYTENFDIPTDTFTDVIYYVRGSDSHAFAIVGSEPSGIIGRPINPATHELLPDGEPPFEISADNVIGAPSEPKP